MKAKHLGLGVKFGGRCAVCGRETGNREFEKAQTSLYKKADGTFAVVHPTCAGGSTKNSGGVKYRIEPKAEIEVN